MKKLWILVLSLMLTVSGIYAQEKQEEPSWKKGGHFGFVFAQSAFKNWTAGGENAISGNIKINYDLNYKKNVHDWATKFLINYGMTRIGGIDKKTDDLFEINSIYGRRINDNWNFTFYGNFKTQFTTGYDYSTSPFTKISNAFAPAFLSFGPGLSFKKSENFYINYAPVTSKFIFVNDPDLNATGAFGVDPGKSMRYEFGSNLQMFLKVKLMENVEFENMLNLFSNYLDNPQNVDVDNKFVLRMKVNKYLSATLGVNTLYDDNTIQKIQLSEIFGVEFGFDF